jgi:putative membrane protein
MRVLASSLSGAASPLPLIVVFAALGAVYAAGVRRLPKSRRRISSAAFFYLGLLVLMAAILSPLDHLALELLSAHMVQHMLLLIVAPPLVLLGRPVTVLALAAPREWSARLRKLERSAIFGRAAGMLDNAVVALIGLTVSLWAWHLPAIYEAALRIPALHAAEHATFVAAGLLLWNSVVGAGARRRPREGKALFLLFANGLQSAALGAILTFAGRPLYPLNSAGASAWNLTALEDQQAAGAIMWIPGGLVYTLTMAIVMWRWFTGLDRTSPSSTVDRTWGGM